MDREWRRSLKIPRFALVTFSSWGARAFASLVSFVSMPLMLRTLTIEQYSVYSILAGLGGWFALGDLCFGVATQTEVSNRRAVNASYGSIAAGGLILAAASSVVLGAASCAAAFFVGRHLLGEFSAISPLERIWAALIMMLFPLLTAGFGAVGRILLAEQHGYVISLVPAVAQGIGVAAYAALALSNATHHLLSAALCFTLPPALIWMAVYFARLSSLSRLAISWKECRRALLPRAGAFFLFGILAAAVLNIDYIVAARRLSPDEIASYVIATKIFMLAYFLYTSMLQASWPDFTEALKRGDLHQVKSRLLFLLGFGFLSVFGCAAVFLFQKEGIISLLAGSQVVPMPSGLIIVMGIYFIVRVWTDAFALLLQSRDDLKPLLAYIPVQALISVVVQWHLAGLFGAVGLVIGLITSYLLTASWILPWRFWQKLVPAV